MEKHEIDKILELFKSKNKIVHVILKNQRWMNGRIKEINTDFFMLDDKKLGLTPIFHEWVYNISEYSKEVRR